MRASYDIELAAKDQVIEELKAKNIIKSSTVARVMKEVDRADFTDMLPYTDW